MSSCLRADLEIVFIDLYWRKGRQLILAIPDYCVADTEAAGGHSLSETHVSGAADCAKAVQQRTEIRAIAQSSHSVDNQHEEQERCCCDGCGEGDLIIHIVDPGRWLS